MTSWPWPTRIAHRGGGTLAPENTLAGLREAAARGFRAVEFDVMLSADQVPLLIHDETLERTTDGAGEVALTPWSRIATLDAGAWLDPRHAGARVPRFDEAARLCVALGLWANVEAKPAPGHERDTGLAAARIAAQVWPTGATPAQALPLMSSFSEQALHAVREAAPELPRALLVDRVPPDWRDRMRSHDCVALHTNHRHLEAATARAIKDAGYGLACYTVNDPEIESALHAMGVDAVFTDRLDLFPPA